MQAIETKFIGPTNHRGARVKASAQAGSITLSWDHALGVEGNHDAAAVALADKFGWANATHGVMVRGAKADDSGNVYVFVKGLYNSRDVVGGRKAAP